MSKLLREGDVIELVPGHTVYIELPEHFVFANREGCFDNLTRTEVTIGEAKGGMPTDWIAGRYVVTFHVIRWRRNRDGDGRLSRWTLRQSREIA